MTAQPHSPARASRPASPLRGVRVLSLALNLPGPAALMRLQRLGARCVKLEPPAPPGGRSGDPMGAYSPQAYAAMHEGIRLITADLKTPKGQQLLHRELSKTDVLITSFRPSALRKLGLTWAALRRQHPALSMVRIVGAPGARAEEPGHDLTYLADNDLVTGLDLPASLYADMGGSLMTSEAVLLATLTQRQNGRGSHHEIALSEAAAYLALPRAWGLTLPGAAVGGGHAGYRVYPCQDGRVALAALEPHFAKSLCALAGIAFSGMATMMAPATHDAVAQYLQGQTRASLDALATAHDIPLHTLPK